MRARLDRIARELGAELVGDGAVEVTRIAPLETADASSISFVSGARYAAQLASTQAACVIVAPSMRDAAVARGAAIVAADPYLAFAKLTQWWAGRTRELAAAGVHATAVVETGALIDATASVGALAFVGAGARVEAGAVIGAQAHVGAGATVGAHTRLAPRVVFGDGCRIGQRGILHGGAVIGADGFGFAPHEGRYEKIEQLGAVVIGDDVEIGANTCIDRGALEDTVIADGVKLDNLIQIAHNVRIGRHTAMAAFVGVAGSATIGAFCQIGGAARIMGHITICDHVQIDTTTFVSRSIARPGRYSGAFPFDDNASWEKNAATLRHLHQLRDRVRALEREVQRKA